MVQVRVVLVLFHCQLELACCILDHNLENNVLRLRLHEPVVHFDHFVVHHLAVIVGHSDSLEQILHTVKVTFCPDQVADWKFRLNMIFSSLWQNGVDLIIPSGHDHSHDRIQSRRDDLLELFIDCIDDNGCPLWVYLLFEHLFHDTKHYFELLRWLRGNFGWNAAWEAIRFFSYLFHKQGKISVWFLCFGVDSVNFDVKFFVTFEKCCFLKQVNFRVCNFGFSQLEFNIFRNLDLIFLCLLFADIGRNLFHNFSEFMLSFINWFFLLKNTCCELLNNQQRNDMKVLFVLMENRFN